jgi:hypothetical protein
MSKRSFCIGIIVFIIVSTSCRKTQYIDLNGTINGHIEQVHDEFGGLLEKDSISVEIMGTSISTKTDDQGRFSLTNVSTGTYDIKFSRGDIADYQYQDLQFIGGNHPYVIMDAINLVQKSTTKINNFQYELTSFDINFEIEIQRNPGDSNIRSVVLFYNDDDRVSPENRITSQKGSTTGTSVNIDIDIDYLRNRGIDTLYVKAYGDVYIWYYPMGGPSWYYDRYYNRETGEYIWPGINYEGASQTFRIVLPE